MLFEIHFFAYPTPQKTGIQAASMLSARWWWSPIAALVLATAGAWAATPYMPLTCCGFDTTMMLEHLFKCKIGEEGMPWSRYCANAEAQHCAHYIQQQNDGAHFCCERCRLRALGEWDNNPPPELDEPVTHRSVRVEEDGFTFPEW